MKTILVSAVALACGLVFAAGTLVSGMANPAKVLNFFDVLGTWDPTLAFVMGSGLVTTLVGYRIVFARRAPVLASEFLLPQRRDIDASLVLGSGIFGLGWGLGGLCPGPALAALPIGGESILTFVVAMVLGIAAAKALKRMMPLVASAKV